MKKLIITSALFLLAACSAPQQPTINLDLKPVTTSSVPGQGKAVSLTSRDLRTAQFIAVVDNGRQQVQPLQASQNLRVALEEVLSNQLRSQGFNVTAGAKGTVRLDILDALVKVEHSVFSHHVTSNVQIQIVAESPKGKFVKRYNGKSITEGAGSASVEDMEASINNLLNSVLKDVAADQELSLYMVQNF
ncbi:YajG family lipoprotein [Parasalinivibrio latis]|uniref:YajG family lipoprotein n=1 Tax=Parasalinivibrio latis TaxID=2952610 RepID=UPI0030E42421